MYLRFLLYAFLIYLLYRLIFHFIIPVYKTTKQVKKQFRDMQSRMEEQMNQQTSFTSSPEGRQADDLKKSTSKDRSRDYIDFEEMK